MTIGEIAVYVMLSGVGFIALFMGIALVFPCFICPTKGSRDVRTDSD